MIALAGLYAFSSGVSKGIYEWMIQSGWTLCVSRSTPDREKPSGISHKWRCIKAIASAKVGDDLSYQAALLSKMRKVQLGPGIAGPVLTGKQL